MPINVTCPHCQHAMRVKDELAGKRAKCPKCQKAITIGETPLSSPGAPSGAAPRSQPASQPTASQQIASPGSPSGSGAAEWTVQAADQQTYGPITKAELDSWAKEGRINSECQILKEGWPQWKWADEVYPNLGGGSSSGSSSPDPFAAFANQPQSSPAPTGGGFPVVESKPGNPYQASGSASNYGDSGSDTTINDPHVIRAMQGTQLWLIILLVLMALYLLGTGGVLLIWGILSIPLISRAPVMLIPLFFSGMFGFVGPAIIEFIGFQVWMNIGRFIGTRTTSALAKAQAAQRNYYMSIVIYFLVTFLSYIAMVALMALLGAALMEGFSRGMSPSRF